MKDISRAFLPKVALPIFEDPESDGVLISRANVSRVAERYITNHMGEGPGASGHEQRGFQHILSMPPHVCVSDTRFTCPHAMHSVNRPCNTHASYGHALVWTARADHVAEQ